MGVAIRSPELLVELDRGARGRLSAQLERRLRESIRDGRLVAGTRLPSTRALACELGVARGTVVAAYQQLAAEGYLALRRGAAPRVAHAVAPVPAGSNGASRRAPAPRWDLRPDVADYAAFPRREWLTSLRGALGTALDSDLGYGDAHGAAALRDALAAYLGRSRGVAATPERMVTGVGFTHVLSLVCAALRRRGVRCVGVEDPGHPALHRIVAHAGMELVPLPVDESGVVVDAVRAADPESVLVTPAHQFPTAAVLAPERRAELLAWAARNDRLVLEDDVDAEFRYDVPPVGALQGLAPERVAYLGSVSRTLAPALRMGWGVLPSWLADDVVAEVHGTFLAPPRLDQLALAAFLERGELDRHLRRMRLRYRRRRDALLAALAATLPAVETAGAAAGLHVVARLPEGADEAAVVEAARSRRIALSSLGEHRLVAGGPPALLLGFARTSEAGLRAAIRELAEALAQA